MRFLSMIRVDENTGQTPSEQLMTDMGKLIEPDDPRGHVDQNGRDCGRQRKVARVRLRGGTLSTVDGPFTETNEVIGGFAILEARIDAGSDRAHEALPGDPRRLNGTSSAKCVRWKGPRWVSMHDDERTDQLPTPNSQFPKRQRDDWKLEVGSWELIPVVIVPLLPHRRHRAARRCFESLLDSSLS